MARTDDTASRVGRGWIFWTCLTFVSLLCVLAIGVHVLWWMWSDVDPTVVRIVFLVVVCSYPIALIALSFRPAPGLQINAPEVIDGIALPERSVAVVALASGRPSVFLIGGSDGVVRLGRLAEERWSEVVEPDSVVLRSHWTGLCEATVGATRCVVLVGVRQRSWIDLFR